MTSTSFPISAASVGSPPPVYDANDGQRFNDAELPAYPSGNAGGLFLNALPLDLTEHVERSLSGNVLSNSGKEFTYELVKGKEKPWAFLTVLGDSVVSLSKGIPTIVEGEKVEGKVEVALDGDGAFQAVMISVRGQIIGGAQTNNILTFLEISKVLWSSSPNPLSGKSRATNILPGPKQKLNKLVPGSHSWPFSIALPKEIALTVGTKDSPRVEVCRLPQTFFERHARAKVQYEVIVRFVRGFLKTDWRLSTQFAYIPITTPPPPSPLRVLAYQECTLLLGPEADPEGWVTLDPVRIRGRTGWNKEVDAWCVMSIASPLSYTRGSVIPLSLVIKCKDSRTLELFSSPRAIVVRLRRCLRYHSDDRRSPESYSWIDEYEHSELATWWPDSLPHPRARSTSNHHSSSSSRERLRQGSRDTLNTNSRESLSSTERRNGSGWNSSRSASRDWSRGRRGRDTDSVNDRLGEQLEDFDERHMRFLKGEIHLQTDLKPSTAMTRFRVEYSVVLFPPDISGFHVDSSSSSCKGGTLLAQPVEITTAYAPGPRPSMYAPPQYESGFPGTALPGDRLSGLFQ